MVNLKNKAIYTVFLLCISHGSLMAQSEVDQVKQVIWHYKLALEALDVSNTNHLFTSNSKIYETGKSEGSFSNYIEHHIGPELSHFKSFEFTNYTIDVTVAEGIAYSTETYNYTIELVNEERTIVRQGVSTSVLIKEDDKWRIHISHNSSRPIRN